MDQLFRARPLDPLLLRGFLALGPFAFFRLPFNHARFAPHLVVYGPAVLELGSLGPLLLLLGEETLQFVVGAGQGELVADLVHEAVFLSGVHHVGVFVLGDVSLEFLDLLLGHEVVFLFLLYLGDEDLVVLVLDVV